MSEELNTNKRLINKNTKLYKILVGIKKIVFFTFSFIAKGLNLIKIFFGYLSSKFVFISKGNSFYDNFHTDFTVIKKIKFKNTEIKVKINTFWDYWRISNFEKYPVDCVLNDVGEYDKNSKKLIYYEIGCNVGYSSLLISKILSKQGKVYSFEVEPTNYKTLCDNVILNKIDNIIPFNIGIASKNSISKFFYNTKHLNNKFNLPMSAMGMHSLKFDEKVHKKEVCCFVPLLNLDHMIKTFNLEKPTHLFIDAYGAELEIIKSIKSTPAASEIQKMIIDIEENVEDVEKTKAFEIMKDMNFKLIFSEKEIGENYVPNSFKTIFEKKI